MTCHTDIELNTPDQIKEFVLTVNKRKGELCGNHKISQWVIDNWDKIATECYIDTKAKNLSELLGLNISRGQEGWEALTGIVYTTGHEIDYRKEKADGWVNFNNDDFKENDKAEIKKDGLLGVSVIKGKIIKAHDGRMFFLPKGNRSRGYYLTGYEKLRKI